MTASNLINLLCFQVGWLVAVLGAAHGYPWLGPGYAMCWLAWHLRRQDGAGAELKLLLAAAVLGYLADSVLVVTGFVQFPPMTRLGAPSTLWMISLWMMFAATLRHSLAWLRGRMTLAIAFGAIGGPLAYWAGTRLEALVLSDGVNSLMVVAIEWAMATPLLLAMACWFEGRAAGCRAEPLADERA